MLFSHVGMEKCRALELEISLSISDDIRPSHDRITSSIIPLGLEIISASGHCEAVAAVYRLTSSDLDEVGHVWAPFNHATSMITPPRTTIQIAEELGLI